jgi:bifunctional N-acetylglucosamine-1-phosphate-uridyltransferase/glucosamine-1-phosphate-acetyltransferase GlmU-like protein
VVLGRHHAHRPARRIAGRETLRKLVVDFALAVSRTEQKNIEGWAEKKARRQAEQKKDK